MVIILNDKFTIIVQPLVCPYCRAEFISSDKYNIHVKEHKSMKVWEKLLGDEKKHEPI